MQGVLGKHSVESANSTIQERVLGTQGMTSIENYVSAVDPETRGMDAQLSINTIYGPTEIEVANYGNY